MYCTCLVMFYVSNADVVINLDVIVRLIDLIVFS